MGGVVCRRLATTTARFLLRGNADQIRIRGSLPRISENLRDQRLKVFCAGVQLTEFAVSFGDFEHVVPLNPREPAELLEVTIEAARSFRAKRVSRILGFWRIL
jgi:hypothetical protein